MPKDDSSQDLASRPSERYTCLRANTHRQTQTGGTIRAIILGLILIPVNIYWIIQIEMVRAIEFPTILALFFNVITLLFILVLLNLILKKWAKKYALTQGELIIIYVMLALTSAISGHDMMAILVPSLSHPFWFATPENEWTKLFLRDLPQWLTVKDKDTLLEFYEGGSTLYTAKHLMAWLYPFLWWAAFTFALVFVTIGINMLLRKQWVDVEKLSYPIIQLPLEMTDTQSGLFRSGLFWIAFALSCSVDLINAFHSLYPVVPYIPVKDYEIGHLFTEKPWNAIGHTPVAIYPFAIGISFFLPLGLSFSCWFFYILLKLERVIGSAAGFRSLPGFPYSLDQAFGAYLAFGIMAIWGTRRHLLMVLKKVIGKSDTNDSSEPISYRTTVAAIMGAVFFILFFCVKAGMSISAIIAFFSIYYIISIAITRMRAELGPPGHSFGYWELTTFVKPKTLGKRNLIMFSFFFFFSRQYRSHPMPQSLEAFKMAERSSLQLRRIFYAMVLALILGIISTFILYLHVYYKFGAASRIAGPAVIFGNQIFNRLSGWLHYPTHTDLQASIFTGIGFIFTVFLTLLRRRFLWWPFYPASYPLVFGGLLIMNYLWFSIFIAWLIKRIILQAGSLGLYRRVRPFFLGLILGQFVFRGVWSIIEKIPIYGKTWAPL